MWKRLGKVFCSSGEYPWMTSHAANPVACPMSGGLFRIYFNARDSENRSCITWLEVDIADPLRVLRIADRPVLSPGERGAFDDSGCSMGCLLRVGDRYLLYYMGWNLGVTVPWRNAIGLATSEDGVSFSRVSVAPVMDRSEEDPYTLSYPWVIRQRDGFEMWYGSNLNWVGQQADLHHVIKRATSNDGLIWRRDGKVCISAQHADGNAFARPCIMRDPDIYRAWYAWRGSSYRIGYAESTDGVTWIRRHPLGGLEPSGHGWDGESVCYPSLFDYEGRRFMLYCGNGYGRTGFGLAVQS